MKSLFTVIVVSIVFLTGLSAETIAHRELLDGTEGHLEYQVLYSNSNCERKDYFQAGLTLGAYGKEKGVGQIEVNFVNSKETAIEELQIATRLIMQFVNRQSYDFFLPKFCWLTEARGDIRFVKVEIPEVPFIDLSSLEGLRESERFFYLTNAGSYLVNDFVVLGLTSTTIFQEYKQGEGKSETRVSWQHTLSTELVLDQKTGFGFRLDITSVSSLYHRPQYEITYSIRTPILTKTIPICLETKYRNTYHNYTGDNWSQFSLQILAIGL